MKHHREDVGGGACRCGDLPPEAHENRPIGLPLSNHSTKSPPDSGGLYLGIAIAPLPPNKIALFEAQDLMGRLNHASSLWAGKRLAIYMVYFRRTVNEKGHKKAPKQEKARKVAGYAKMSAFALPQLPHDFFKRLIARPSWL
ncbi:MAG: hypothetical protein WCP35_19995 [Verrucomicrobiota bacterium]